jgi:16S rRNA processing protein RimM
MLTDDPEHLKSIKRLYLNDEPVARRVQGVRLHAGNALVKLQGVNNPEAARALQGMTARIAGSDARPLEEGEFRLYQLIGLEVVDEAGARIGTVTDLLETGANDVFIIEPGDGAADILLPYHESVVLQIDPDAGRMVVRPPTYYGE